MAVFSVTGTLVGYSVVPSLAYEDDTGNWLPLPGGATITTTGFSFIHPDIYVIGPHTVSVRDANAPTIFGVSPTFQVVAPESVDGTIVTTVGPAITDAGGAVWTITAGAKVARNGVTDNTTSGVIELAYVAHVIYQENSNSDWYAWNGSSWVGPQTSPLGTQAKRVFKFTDGVGVNTHLNYSNQAGWASATTLGNSLAYIKCHHIRDNVVSGGWLTELQQLNTAAGGVSLCLNSIYYNGNIGTVANLVTDAAAAELSTPGIIQAIEGPNECDLNPSYPYAGLTGSAAGNKMQQDVFAAVKANSTLASKTVLAWPLGGYGNFAQEGNQNAYSDAGALHDYTFGAQAGSIASYEQTYWMPIPPVTFPGRAIWSTEMGYFSNPLDNTLGPGGWGVDEPTQGRLLLTQLLTHVNLGFVRSYIYSLHNNIEDTVNGENNFGLFHADGTPKASANYLKNFQTFLDDQGATKKTFNTGSIKFTLSGLPSGGTSLLLQKSTGVYYLCLWNDVSIWDISTHTAKSIAVANVLVSLVATYSLIRVLDPITNTVVQSITNAASVTVALSDHAVLVELTP